MPTKAAPKPIGRPRMAKGQAKSTTVLVRMSAEDRKAIEKAAAADGKNVSEWVRKKLLEAE